MRQPNPGLLLAVALAVKLLLVGMLIAPTATAWVQRFESSMGYDDSEYYRIARQMSAHGSLMFSGRDEPQIYRTPIYPAFLTALGIACRWHPLAMVLLQAVIFSVAPMLLWLVLRRAGYATGFTWLLVLDPITNILALTFMVEGLFILFLLAGFYWLQHAERLPQRLGAVCAFSLAILVKPSVQFFYVMICLYLLFRFRPRLPTLAVIVVSALPLLGWMARNHQVAGLWAISTQVDNSILIPEAIKSKEAGVADPDVLADIGRRWGKGHQGQSIYAPIMDNKIDFQGVAVAYALHHPLILAKYHALGSLRVLFGSARNHLKACFPSCANWTPKSWRMYNLGMIAFYLLLYLALLTTFRPAALFDRTVWLAGLFVLYNVGLIGSLAYTTGGGLKRAPFIPFLIIALAGQWAYIRRRKWSGVRPQAGEY